MSNATYYKCAEDCPDAAKHTKQPDGSDGYIQWHAWAAKKRKTHTQHRCPTCGFFAIWKRKPTAAVGEE
jgi:DNA-directed RNA polymerase subunit RPC12/RpoP